VTASQIGRIELHEPTSPQCRLQGCFCNVSATSCASAARKDLLFSKHHRGDWCEAVSREALPRSNCTQTTSPQCRLQGCFCNVSATSCASAARKDPHFSNITAVTAAYKHVGLYRPLALPPAVHSSEPPFFLCRTTLLHLFRCVGWCYASCTPALCLTGSIFVTEEHPHNPLATTRHCLAVANTSPAKHF
jgi:hypothetical protein